MAPIEITLITIVRTLVSVAFWALLGQGILALLAGSHRHNNLVYKLFDVVTSPVIKAVRFITPKVVIDKHIPFVAFFYLFWLLVLLAYVRRELCAIEGLAC